MTWWAWLLIGYALGCAACLLAHLIGPCPWARLARGRPRDPIPGVQLMKSGGPIRAGEFVYLDKHGRVVSGDEYRSEGGSP